MDTLPAENFDDRATMTIGERTTWVYGALVLVTTAAYLAIVLPQLTTGPVSQIAWQIPMFIAIGIAIGGTIVGTIVATIVGAIISRDPDQGSDIRDRQIERHGDRVTLGVIGVGLGVALLLTMLELDPFYIGSTLFIVGAIGALWGTVAKIRAYRHSFRG